MTASAGHNSLAADQLRGYVSRAERLEEEIAGLNDDKKEVYGEAKACGLDVPTLKKVIQRRRKDKADLHEADVLLRAYEDIVNRPKPDPLD